MASSNPVEVMGVSFDEPQAVIFRYRGRVYRALLDEGPQGAPSLDRARVEQMLNQVFRAYIDRDGHADAALALMREHNQLVEIDVPNPRRSWLPVALAAGVLFFVLGRG